MLSAGDEAVMEEAALSASSTFFVLRGGRARSGRRRRRRSTCAEEAIQKVKKGWLKLVLMPPALVVDVVVAGVVAGDVLQGGPRGMRSRSGRRRS